MPLQPNSSACGVRPIASGSFPSSPIQIQEPSVMPFLAHPLDVPPQDPVVKLAKPHHNGAAAADPEVDELRQLIAPGDGTVLVPGDAGATALLPFNLRTRVLPRVIVSALTAKAISQALDWARRHGIALRGHSGGHSYEGFCSVTGLMIDVRRMNKVTVNLTTRRAVVGAGNQTLELTEKLFAKGVAVPLGSCKPVGIAGVTLGGGHGLSSRKFGLTLDKVVSMRVVKADGTEVIASDTRNRELFWALRGGGGGNFGIVTEFEFKIEPVGQVVIFRIVWQTSSAASAVAAWQRWMETAPDEISAVMVISGAPGKISEIRCAGQFMPRQAGQTPSLTELQVLLAPLVAVPHSTFTLRPATYLEAALYFKGNGDPIPKYFKGKSDYATSNLGSTAINALLAALRAAARPVAVIFEGYGGAINRVPEDQTAFPHRGTTRFCIQYFAEWDKASDSTAITGAVRSVYAAMRPYLPGWSYVNYTDRDLTNWATAYYKGNLPRLIRAKQTYDPANIFNFAQSIPLV